MATAFDTHSKLAEAQLRKAFGRFTPNKAKDIEVVVEVLSGLHAGTRAMVKGPSFTIGSNMSHDIMLIDDKVFGSEVEIQLEPSVIGPIVMAKSTTGRARLGGQDITSDDWSSPQRLPCDLECDGIALRLIQSTSPQKSTASFIENRLVPLLFTVATVAFGTQIWLSFQPTSPVTLEGRSVAVLPQEEPTADIASLVRSTIDEAGLANRLAVHDAENGAIFISGALPSALLPDWNVARSTIDSFGPDATVIAKVDEAPRLQNLPPITMVALGDDAEIFFADGKTAGIGDILQDDWAISNIDESSIEVARDGETVIIDY